jgi:hypothetical protein
LVSQFTEGSNDLLKGTLIGEVLLGGDFKEGSDEGSIEGVSGKTLLDSLEVLLDTFNLNEGRVSDLGKENKRLVNSLNCLVVLSNFSFIFLSLLLSVKGFLIK